MAEKREGSGVGGWVGGWVAGQPENEWHLMYFDGAKVLSRKEEGCTMKTQYQ